MELYRVDRLNYEVDRLNLLPLALFFSAKMAATTLAIRGGRPPAPLKGKLKRDKGWENLHLP